MKIRVSRGAGYRARQLDLLPSIDVGWKRGGFDIGAAFLCWYAWAEVWWLE